MKAKSVPSRRWRHLFLVLATGLTAGCLVGVPAQAAAKAVKPVAKPVEEAPPAPLSDDQRAIAAGVHVGSLPCEHGEQVHVEHDKADPGRFLVRLRKSLFRMTPVPSATGAVRLEDHKSGVMYLQLGTKSMLMNEKLGQRMADDCRSPSQHALTEHLKTQPPVNVLEPTAAARPVTTPVSASSPP